MATKPREITLQDLLAHKERIIRIQAQAILQELEALEKHEKVTELPSRSDQLKRDR